MMNKKVRNLLLSMSLSLMALGLTSCEKEVEVADNSNSDELTAINSQFVDGTVLPTYASLSDAAIQLYGALKTLRGSKTDANVAAAAALWNTTRVYWEESEAFLFGPVDVLGIDPHIDTWPMAEEAFVSLMKNETLVRSYDNGDGDKNVSSTDNEDGLLGFHSIEYILFRDGKIRKAAEITELELIYVVAVAGDLRNQCCLIEAGWLGESGISDEKLGYAKRAFNFDELGRYYSTSFSKTMKETPNSKFSSARSSSVAILDGCIDIADEVGTMKIGAPYNGASDDDKNYIESKFSYNSKVDFAGNIRSIQNAYLGGIPSKRGASVSDLIKKLNPSLNGEVKTGIDNAIAKIDAMQNFETNAQNNSSVQAAMEACLDLLEKLETAKSTLQNY